MGLRCSKYFQMPWGLSGSYKPFWLPVSRFTFTAEKLNSPVGSLRPMGSTSMVWAASVNSA